MQRAVLTACVLAALATVDAQEPPASPAGQPTFRTSATLATIDAVVTDDRGNPVPDLTPGDFEIVVGGKKQAVQQAAYVTTTGPNRSAASGAVAARPQEGSAGASATLRRSGLQPDEINRTIAFVVDDLNLSFESTFYVRAALQKYVDTQLQPGDLVAIVRTASGIGALQQFTTDKRLLHLAISRLQWDFRSLRAISAFLPVNPNGPVGTSETGIREEMTASGSLSAVQFIARGVQHLPGRKSIVLLSEGYPSMFRERMEGGRLWNALRRMLDEVNRAGAVLYTINAAGLQTGGLTAEDNPQLRDWGPMQGPSVSTYGAAQVVRDAARDRVEGLLDSLESLRFIATQTGGLAIVSKNDLNMAIQRVLDDQRGYYLLGYSTRDGQIPSGWNQDNVRVRVTRPGLHVRSRQGFFGPATPEKTKAPPTSPLLRAALSPFGSGDITVRLTSVFGHDGTKKGAFVRSLLFIDPADIQFQRDAEGRYTGDLQLMVLAVGDNGEILGDWRRALPMRLTEEQYRQARERGIVYSSRMKVKWPGAYQVRAAVLDTASGKAGSGSQFLEVPKVGSGKLAMSGVMLKGLAGQTHDSDDTLSIAGPALVRATLQEPTIRMLSPGTRAAYAYEIYDGLKDSTGLMVSTTLVRNGKTVYESPETPVPPAAAKKGPVRVIPIAGSLDLGKDMPAGPYSLQVIVARHRDGKIDRRAAQWVDFEVRR
jgi:VWFA-related protein